MKKPLFYLFLLLQTYFVPVVGQISEGGVPPSFNYPELLRSELSAKEIKINFNIEDLKLVDEWRVSRGGPLRVARLIETDLTIENSGELKTLPGGEKIWQLRLQVPDAIALLLYYKEFYIPEGGKLYIYNIDKTQVLGAYTHRSNPEAKEFATEFIAGDDILLEYVFSENEEIPRIHIENIGYGYNHLSIQFNPDLRSSGSCMVNINCEEGDAWQAEKRGVCKMVQKVGKSTYICSASLINNTAEDLTPYILSAYHCSDDGVESASQTDYLQWVFYFNYEREGCSRNSTIAKEFTRVGCKELVAIPIDGGSDGLLLVLNNSLPENADVYFNGWDRRNIQPQSGVSIHHPSGDYKKISTYNQPPVHTTWYGEDEETGETSTGKRNAHWNVIFSKTANGHGVTEGGSSGSPLFNENKLIVGTLTGGNSTCLYLDGWNLYGKMYFHWDQYGTDKSERMDVWLDPLGTGVETLSGRYQIERKEAPSGLTATFQNGQVYLEWTAPVKDGKPTEYKIYCNNVHINTTTNLFYVDQNPEIGAQIYGVSAIYSDQSESMIQQISIDVVDYKAPLNVTAEKTDENEVTLSWDTPIYEQTVFWGTGEYESIATLGIPSFYFGQLWDEEDIFSVYNKQIKAVQMIPVVGTYEIYILQGNRSYRQKINNPVYDKLNSIELDEPFTIGSEALVVSLYATDFMNSSSNYPYPIAADGGPAVIGKGNLVSEDGVNWEYAYDEENFDLNFVVGAVISSKEGNLPMRNYSLPVPLQIKKGNMHTISKKAVSYNLSFRSRIIYQFPEITGYNVYRNANKLNSSPVNETKYIDKNVPDGRHIYQVSTVYGNEESAKIRNEEQITVDNEVIVGKEPTIYPTLFTNSVRVVSSGLIEKIEVYTLEGKLVEQFIYPETNISTSAWATGIYIFRIYEGNKVHIMKAIKK